MNRLVLTAGALAAAATSASAAGIERTAPSTRVLFEEGRYLEFSATFADPELSGVGGGLDPGGFGTGDLLETFASFGAAYKADLAGGLSYAIILDQPWGVDTNYPAVPTSGYATTSAELNSFQATGILSYALNERVTAYGGVRIQALDATAFFPFGAALGLAGPYQVTADRDYGFGYLVGAAYERPEIALRVALTYYSEIDHTHTTTENNGGAVSVTSTDITTPQSLNLEFQTGVAENTLLFGSVRWVDWSEFAISPPVFVGGVGAPLVDYQDDWTTYTLGLGRRFNETWSGAIQVSHEPAAGYVPLTTLGPVDGRTSLGLAATYTRDNMKVTGGISYTSLGDTSNFAATSFDGGDALGFGIRVGFSF